MAKQEASAIDPTRRAYEDFQAAYDHFNYYLFDGELPNCLITMQRKSNSYGYFSGDRFGEIGQGDKTGPGLPIRMADEIALNPGHFHERTPEEVLSTLVHEMVHLWQHHFGLKKPRTGYHNKEWSAKMEAVGLVPSDTGAVGGKKVGQSMSHFIHHEGPFKAVCAQLTAKGVTISYVDLWTDADPQGRAGKGRDPGAGGDPADPEGKGATTRKKKAASKTKYMCPTCDLNVWAKPDVSVLCGTCNVPLEAEARDED